MKQPAIIRDPSDQRRRVGKRGLEIVEDMARAGHSLTTIAKKLRVHRTTLTEIRKRQPEVNEAIERGYSAMEDELVNRLHEVAMSDRKGNVTAAIFLLKTRRGYEGTKLPSHLTIVNDNRQQSIALPSAEDMQTYLERVAKDG